MKRKPLIDKDGEVRELTEADFSKAKPVKAVLPEIVEMQKRARGRPKSDTTKVSTTLRLDPEIIDFFKRGGRGWQTRINDVLKEHMESH